MTLAETLIQEGRQEGRQEGMARGNIIGRIQISQDLLGLPVSSSETLYQQKTDALQELLRTVETQLRARWQNPPRP